LLARLSEMIGALELAHRDHSHLISSYRRPTGPHC
jgi:hypothetical protein